MITNEKILELAREHLEEFDTDNGAATDTCYVPPSVLELVDERLWDYDRK